MAKDRYDPVSRSSACLSSKPDEAVFAGLARGTLTAAEAPALGRWFRGQEFARIHRSPQHHERGTGSLRRKAISVATRSPSCSSRPEGEIAAPANVLLRLFREALATRLAGRTRAGRQRRTDDV
jgi:hypothetical protein